MKKKDYFYLYKRDTLKIMPDYCSSGIWLNGRMLELKKLPKRLKRLKQRLINWQNKYENFKFYLKKPYEYKLLMKSENFKKFLNEGKDISIDLKKIVKYKYKIEYFNEKNIKIKEIKNKKLKY